MEWLFGDTLDGRLGSNNVLQTIGNRQDYELTYPRYIRDNDGLLYSGPMQSLLWSKSRGWGCFVVANIV